MHWGEVGNDSWGNQDLYTVAVTAFREVWYTLFYVFSMVILGLHLNHGVASAFQTLGLKTQKYLSPIESLAGVFSILVPVAFASIPIILYLQSL